MPLPRLGKRLLKDSYMKKSSNCSFADLRTLCIGEASVLFAFARRFFDITGTFAREFLSHDRFRSVLGIDGTSTAHHIAFVGSFPFGDKRFGLRERCLNGVGGDFIFFKQKTAYEIS